MEDPDNTEIDIPMHLRQPPHPPPDQDCADIEKVVATPVYRGRLEESHERSRRAGYRRPWYSVTYNRWSREATIVMENHGQKIFAALTYFAGGILVAILIGVAVRSYMAKRRLKIAQGLQNV